MSLPFERLRTLLKNFGRLRAEGWDLPATALIIVILLAGVLSKMNEAGWAVLTMVVLCLLLVTFRRGPRTPQ
jgi:hypothetical protein